MIFASFMSQIRISFSPTFSWGVYEKSFEVLMTQFSLRTDCYIFSLPKVLKSNNDFRWKSSTLICQSHVKVLLPFCSGVVNFRSSQIKFQLFLYYLVSFPHSSLCPITKIQFCNSLLFQCCQNDKRTQKLTQLNLRLGNMQNKKLYSINKEAVLLLVLLCVLSYVHLNDASEQVLENYHKSSARWKRNIETKGKRNTAL